MKKIGSKLGSVLSRATDQLGLMKKKDFFILFIIMGCAKAKPDRQPDFTVSVSDLTSARMEIESSGSNEVASNDGQFVTASSEQNKGIITSVAGNSQFTGILSGLKTGIVGHYEVRFSLTPKFIIANALVARDQIGNLTKMDQLLLQSVQTHETRIAQKLEKMDLTGILPQYDLLPIAQVAVASAGVLEHTRNEIGENTPILQLIPTDFTHVEHIIMGHLDTRSRMVLSSEQLSQEVFLEASVGNRVVDYATLRSQTGIKLSLENEKEKLFTERKANKLNLFRFFSKDKLNPDELNALQHGQSDIVRQCSESQAAIVGIAQAECAMVLSFVVPIEVVAVERTRDAEGFETGEMTVRVLGPTERAPGLIRIPQNVEVSEARPDQILIDERKVLRPQQLANHEFLFRRTLQDSPNTFDYAFAGLSGELEIVKFSFEEKSVKIQRAESLLNTTGNSNVDKEVLMEIPADYVIVTRKAPDGSDLPFERLIPSTYTNPEAIAIVDWAANKVPNVSSPLNYFGLENCFNSKTQAVSDVDSRIKKDGMLNFTVVSTYAASSVVDCAGMEMADYFDRLQTIFSFKERISFKEYKKPAIEEPSLDVPLLAQKKLGFGLFTYSKKKPNTAGETHLEDTIVNLPAVFDFAEGKTVTYTLAGLPKANSTDPQAAEKKAVVIEATERVISDLNNSLREATKGTALERSGDFVKLEVAGDEGAGTLGDLDRNYVYYVEKATDSPIIGLGGSHPNPRSGRVEAASVFLYGGNMTKAIARLKRMNQAEAQREEIMAPIPLKSNSKFLKSIGRGEVDAPAIKRGSAGGLAEKLPSFHAVPAKFTKISGISVNGRRRVERNGKRLNKLEYVGSRLNRAQADQKLSPRSARLSKAFEAIRAEGLYANTGARNAFDSQARIVQKISASLGAKAPSKALVSRVRNAQYCVYEAKPDFSPTSIGSNKGKGVGEESDLELLGKMWTATLAHELGHNFGLRHNFIGSYDKNNWSRGEETTRDYSSIMDYLNNDYQTYDGFGPQDVAGLRAGYGEVVEMRDGSLFPIKNIPAALNHKGWLDISKAEISALGVKDFMFCTDEDVGISPTCQLFDEGTTPLEIVENKIRDYKTRYALLNFPNDRVNFNVGNVGSIVGRNISDFIQMRQFLEESIYHLIQGADVQTVVIPELQGALRGMDFFQEIIRTPDASSFMDKDAVIADVNSTTDRFLEFEVNTSQGPMLLHGEAKWMQDVSLDDDLSRLKVVGVELDKVISTIMLTERNFGFPKYESINLRLAYPDIEKLVIDAASPDQLPTVTLLREIMDNNVAAQIETGLGTLNLPTAYQASTTELLRFYAVLGSIANLDVNGLEAADNNSTMFRVFSDLRNIPTDVPVMSRLGSSADLKYWANPENLASMNVIGKGAVLQDVISTGGDFKNLMSQLMAAKHPEMATDANAKPDVDALRKAVAEEIAKFPEGLNQVSVDELEEQLDGALDTAGIVDQILAAGADADLLIQLEQMKNEQRAAQIENPVLGLAVESLFNQDVLAAPQGLDMIAESRALEPHYGNVFQNVETSSQIFSMLHPEYFR